MKTSLRHELRTPLNHIMGYCEMLVEEAPQGGFTRLLPDLEKIHAAGRQLLSVINDLFEQDGVHSRKLSRSLLDHELRTPINQIIGYAELLQEEVRDQGPQSVVPDLERIRNAAEQLLRSIVAELNDPPRADEPAIHWPAIPRAGLAFPPSPTGQGKLLVADDDEANLDMLTRRLRRLGYDTVSVTNGREVMDALRRDRFDLLLLDIQMPVMNGCEVLQALQDDPVLRQIPVIVLSASDEVRQIARCVEMGAEDYLPKPFDPTLLRARISASVEKRRLRESERRAFEALQRSQKRLTDELAEAAAYVRSLLPSPSLEGPVRTDWRFLPSTELGGDAFSHFWLDEHRFAVFLLDVCGHGVGAALLSVAVLNTLCNRTLPGVRFDRPAEVLAALNRSFAMERHSQMFFTIWYGVLDVESSEIEYACGGHPAPVLLDPAEATPLALHSPGAVIGGFSDPTFQTRRRRLSTGSRLYLFSDGLYELQRDDGSTVSLGEFTSRLAEQPCESALDGILEWAAAVRRGAPFEDDVSVLELKLLPSVNPSA